MKIELFREGELYMTIDYVGLGSSDDLVVLPKSLVKDSSLSKQGFEELFYECLKKTKKAIDAYEDAEVIHEQFFQKRKYSCYETFSVVKCRR